MVLTVRSKASKAPGDNYAVAACDGCDARCEASRVPGRTRGDGPFNEAHARALAAGWAERTKQEQRGRKFVTTVRLLCPECNGVEVGA